jgi:hypothetical protein
MNGRCNEYRRNGGEFEEAASSNDLRMDYLGIEINNSQNSEQRSDDILAQLLIHA